MTFFQVIAAVLVAWCSGALFGLGLLGWPSGRFLMAGRKQAPAAPSAFQFSAPSPQPTSAPAPAPTGTPSRVIAANAFRGLDKKPSAWPRTPTQYTGPQNLKKRDAALGAAGRKRRPWAALRTVLEIVLVLSIALGAVWAVGYFTVHGKPAAVAQSGR